jgi:TonB family protein
MKNKTSKNTFRIFLASFLIALVPGISSAIENFESLKVLSTKLPGYPTKMTYEGIYEGWARVVINVNEKGELADVYLESYSHPEFGNLAETYIKKWTFQPAKLNGEPLSVIKPIDFHFEDRRGVFALGIQEAAASKLQFSRFAKGKRVYSPKELDEIPTPVEMSQPLFPEEFKGKNVEGSATVIFYIDELGDVRMPHVTEYSHESFGLVALMAVEEWKFDPPKVNGKPVSIMVRQKFNFKEGIKKGQS